MAKRPRTKAQRKVNAESVRTSGPIRVGQVEKLIRGEMHQEIKDAALAIVRPVGKPPGRTAFQSVMKAREILAQSAVMAARLVGKAAKVAASRGDSSPAEFLLKHTSAQDDKGKMVRPISTSVDKLEDAGGSRGPTINVGWIVGPSRPASEPSSALPTIDVQALPEPSDR